MGKEHACGFQQRAWVLQPQLAGADAGTVTTCSQTTSGFRCVADKHAAGCLSVPELVQLSWYALSFASELAADKHLSQLRGILECMAQLHQLREEQLASNQPVSCS